MPTPSSVRKATLADAPRLAQTLASAFQDDPVITWIFPDQHRCRRVLPAFMGVPPPQAGLPPRRGLDGRRRGGGRGLAAAAWAMAACPAPSGCGCCLPWSGFLVRGPSRCWVGWGAWRRGTRTIGPTGTSPRELRLDPGATAASSAATGVSVRAGSNRAGQFWAVLSIRGVLRVIEVSAVAAACEMEEVP